MKFKVPSFLASRKRRTAASNPARAFIAREEEGEEEDLPSMPPCNSWLDDDDDEEELGRHSLMADWNARTPGAAGDAHSEAAVKNLPRSSEVHASTTAMAPGVMP